MAIDLREIRPSDLPIIFEQQLDDEANAMAAFIQRDPTDRAAFDAHWERILKNDTIIKLAIVERLADGEERFLGNIGSFIRQDQRELGYWIGREFWGRGVATQALQLFLKRVQERPLYAGAAKDNAGSIRVLEKCGFRLLQNDRAFAKARGMEIEEATFVLMDTSTK